MIVEKTDTGFSAYSVDYPIFTTGSNIADLIGNAQEATSLYYADQHITITKENLKLEFDFSKFFQYYKVINSKFLADKIGMNASLLLQYVTGHKNHSNHKRKKY